MGNVHGIIGHGKLEIRPLRGFTNTGLQNSAMILVFLKLRSIPLLYGLSTISKNCLYFSYLLCASKKALPQSLLFLHEG